MAKSTPTYIETLAELISSRGPIPTVRVSVAKARGKARNYPYWGAALYEIRLAKKDGAPTNAPLRGASSDRRSLRLAKRDADELAERIGGVRLDTIGHLTERDAFKVLAHIEKAAA